MEPLDDKELNELLQQWEAPLAPKDLRPRQPLMLPPKKPWWQWLLTGSVRIPVPAAVAIAVVIGLWVYGSKLPRRPAAADRSTVSLADFQPVRQLQPVLVHPGEKR
jgi:hypothetical protein